MKDVITSEIMRKHELMEQYFQKKYQKEYIEMEEPLREFFTEVNEAVRETSH